MSDLARRSALYTLRARRSHRPGLAARLLPFGALMALLLIPGSLGADSPTRTPTGLSHYGVLLQTGTYDASTPHPTVPGCFGGVCDGLYFQAEVMGRTPAEIVAQEAAAKTYFLTRFGLDADDPALVGRTFFFPFMIDPRGEYRLYTLSGESVPPEGWVVFDGGYSLLVTDPDGLTLGGAHPGLHIPAGSFIVYGDYKIQKTKANGKPDGEIVLHYQSPGPVILDHEGSHLIRCAIQHDEWGEGLAQGSYNATILPDGRFQPTLRNVFTFPAPSGFGGGKPRRLRSAASSQPGTRASSRSRMPVGSNRVSTSRRAWARKRARSSRYSSTAER